MYLYASSCHFYRFLANSLTFGFLFIFFAVFREKNNDEEVQIKVVGREIFPGCETHTFMNSCLCALVQITRGLACVKINNFIIHTTSKVTTGTIRQKSI